MTRPRLLLIPVTSELEWVIRPQLAEWAEVAAFDAPGVGDEPAPDQYGSDAVAELAERKADGLGWKSYVVAADEYAIAAALKLSARRRDAVAGLALGHACLTFSPDADPPAVNAEVRAAYNQLAKFDDRTLMRHLTQITQGQYGDALADRMLERIPSGVAAVYHRKNTSEQGGWIADALRDLGKPMLLAEHDPCLLFTKEGYEAAASAFPEAMRVSCREKPSVSVTFAEALRAFCRELFSS